MYDILITGGRIVDGTGSPWFRADLGIVGDRLVALGPLAPAEARTVVDATGLVVAPGFVDFHSHSDVTLLVNPRGESAIRQGITTQMVGLCGFSAAPVKREDIPRYQTEGLVFGYEGYTWDWTTIAEYLERLRAAQPSLNVLTLVGHAPVRAAVMGHDARPPSPEEMVAMKGLVQQAIDEGAMGFSTGLTYSPGCYADTEELIELARVLRPYGLAYHTHLRDAGAHFVEAVAEALRIAEEAGIPAYLSHMYAAGQEHWVEKVERAVALVEAARGRGVEASFDITPWLRGGGPFQQSIPGWAREGGMEAMLRRFADPALRARIKDELEHGFSGGKGWVAHRWDDALIARVGRPRNDGWVGKTIGELARERSEEPVDTALNLLAEDDGQFWTAPVIKCDHDVDLLLSHRLGIPITDGMALAPYGPLGRPEMPKSYGTFPRVLGYYVRERGLLTLEAAVNKLSGEPARRLGLWDRGILRPGLAADVTVFDPATVSDKGSFSLVNQYPVGITCVVVNGQITLDQGEHTGASAGRVLGYGRMAQYST